MGKVQWNIKASTIDDFDRSKQFTPYAGPEPRNSVYMWQIKKMQYVPGTRTKVDQLRVGLELAAREGMKDELKFDGYFIMLFIPIADNTAFRYVPLCDALDVSGTDFTDRMLADREGNVTRIGAWRNDGEQYIMAQLADGSDEHGNPRKEIKWIGPLQDDVEGDDSDDDFDEEYADDDEAPF